MSTKSIAVAMSGGVDSPSRPCFAPGPQCGGASLCNLESAPPRRQKACRSAGETLLLAGRRLRRQEAVAQSIGIPYYVVNHEDRFEREVVEAVRARIISGVPHSVQPFATIITKFDQLLMWRASRRTDLLATGHYARVRATRTLAAGFSALDCRTSSAEAGRCFAWAA